MRWLICAFVARIWHKTRFRMTWPKYQSKESHLNIKEDSDYLPHCSPVIHIKSLCMTKQTKWHVCPAKPQISLGFRQVWSVNAMTFKSLWAAKDPTILHVDSEDSDQTERMPKLIWVMTGRMPRLIWVFAGHTVILLVLSWGGSFISFTNLPSQNIVYAYLFNDLLATTEAWVWFPALAYRMVVITYVSGFLM